MSRSHILYPLLLTCTGLEILFSPLSAGEDDSTESVTHQTHVAAQRNGVSVETVKHPRFWFNDLHQDRDGNILGLSRDVITRLNRNFQLDDQIPYEWNRSSGKRTWWYSPHFVFGTEDTYIFGKYYQRGSYRDEYLHVSSLRNPAKKITLDLCRLSKIGNRGGYCGQYDNFAKADFFGDGRERVVVNELDISRVFGEQGGSRIHIVDVERLVLSGEESLPSASVQTLETDPINYSRPLTRRVAGATMQEVLFLSYPSSWTGKPLDVGINRLGKVRLTRLYGDSSSGQVEVEYLSTIRTRHKKWHVVESIAYGGPIMARTYRSGKRLEVRDMDGRVLNRWKLGWKSLGVERILGWHEFPRSDCSSEQGADYRNGCFRTIAVLTEDWFSCDFPVLGRSIRCPTRILELHESGRWDEIYSISVYETGRGKSRGFVKLDDGRVAFSVNDAIYVISVAEQLSD